MEWHIREQNYSRTFRDSSGNIWGYITAKELAGRYPNGGYRIVADLKKTENPSGDITLTREGKKTHLYAYNRKKKRTERTIGYIDVSSMDCPDSFVRIRTGNMLRGVVLPSVLFLLLCAVFLLGWWLSRKEKVPGLDEAAVSYKVEGMENTDPESIALPGVSRIEMKAGTTRVEFPLINPEGNNCYMKYTIRDAHTDEALYSSGLIGPGQAVLSFDLNRPVEAGTYITLMDSNEAGDTVATAATVGQKLDFKVTQRTAGADGSKNVTAENVGSGIVVAAGEGTAGTWTSGTEITMKGTTDTNTVMMQIADADTTKYVAPADTVMTLTNTAANDQAFAVIKKDEVKKAVEGETYTVDVKFTFTRNA